MATCAKVLSGYMYPKVRVLNKSAFYTNHVLFRVPLYLLGDYYSPSVAYVAISQPKGEDVVSSGCPGGAR